MSSNPTPADSPTVSGPVKIILTVLVFTAFVMMLNETTVAVALPAIMADYGISAPTAQWLLTSYMLTMAVVLPTTGWILERFSTRTVFFAATTTFLIGTVIAALAPSFAFALLARIIQAMGTAIIMPLLMTVAMTLVPAQRRGVVIGLIAVVMAVGPALGPTVAGIVLSLTTWHGIFWSMVPLIVLATAIGAVKLIDISEPKSTPLDLLSVALSVITFGGLIYGLSSISTILDGGQQARPALTILLAGLIGLVLFIWRQLAEGRKNRALLDLRPFAVRNFTLCLIVVFSLFMAMFGVLNTLPLYLQGSLLATALVTGLVLLPGGLIEGALSPVFGRLFDLHGPRPLIVPGLLTVVGSLFWLATAHEQSPVWMIMVIHIIFSIGLAALFAPLMTTALGSLPSELYGHGSAILNTLQQLAGAAGTALMITIYSTVSSTTRNNGVPETIALADGASSAFLTSALIAVVALVFSFFITSAPAETDNAHPTTAAKEHLPRS